MWQRKYVVVVNASSAHGMKGTNEAAFRTKPEENLPGRSVGLFAGHQKRVLRDLDARLGDAWSKQLTLLVYNDFQGTRDEIEGYGEVYEVR